MSALAHNYGPLDVSLARGEGAWVQDASGKRYLDLLAGYSALNFGHRHPALTAAAHTQLDRLTLTSRAFSHTLLEPFAQAMTELTGTETLLPMNTGAEAVETAIKAARKWGYDVRGLAPNTASIIVASGAFHGRTTTIVSFSSDPEAHDGFGPFTPGFVIVPFGDADAVAAAIDETTVAVLVEPIQGEAGVIIPPDDYLPRLRTLCDAHSMLLILDEIQSGLGRTGSTLAQDLVGVRADLTTLGKALGGGIIAVSAVVGRADVLGVLTPGTHGSTFGGNPLACAVGLAVAQLLRPGDVQERAQILGVELRARLAEYVDAGLLSQARTVGLWAGIDLADGVAAGTRASTDPHEEPHRPAPVTPGRALCEEMARRGVLAKETHGSTIRLAPPLTIRSADLHHGLDVLGESLRVLAAG